MPPGGRDGIDDLALGWLPRISFTPSRIWVRFFREYGADLPAGSLCRECTGLSDLPSGRFGEIVRGKFRIEGKSDTLRPAGDGRGDPGARTFIEDTGHEDATCLGQGAGSPHSIPSTRMSASVPGFWHRGSSRHRSTDSDEKSPWLPVS